MDKCVALVFAIIAVIVVATDYDGQYCTPSFGGFGSKGSCAENCHCRQIHEKCYPAASGGGGLICDESAKYNCVANLGTSGCLVSHFQINICDSQTASGENGSFLSINPLWL